MKMIFVMLLTLTFFSCTKENTKRNAQPEDIEVMVYATPTNDTTVLASSPVIQLQVR